ncbi:putative disease resistance RPP13-like protein 1 [Corylus avellana]|uniref:putative disease resistance RPP13-like protein 1 n=1 Tax=Corylus avellana TaxID=13451 RepID=UPI00286BC08E|nr:putative disease resistance RPP13-like protein 1 [Corylus avellana]
MAEVGGALISALVEALIDKLASRQFFGIFTGGKLNDRLLWKLGAELRSMNVVLEDAEEKQFTKDAVKDWLADLRDAVYDAEDILDGIASKNLRRKLDADFQTTAIKVRNPISTSLSVKKIETKIEEVLYRLDILSKQKDLLGLRESVGEKSSEKLATTSLVEESEICGRNDEKQAIINWLLFDNASNNVMCVIAIIGMRGIGKTTLAQLVYNDQRVKEHFNLEAWVCVSEEFDVLKVTKTILEAVTLSTFDIKDLNQLQLRLKECLMGKKFLLVLDDVWNDNMAQWEALCKPFKYGALGSKVLVTTRSDRVAFVMSASAMSHRLMELPEEDCWSLFAKHAFPDGNSNARVELEVVGRKIMKKCGGLPLAIKAIGALLRSKLDVDEWDKILKSELWDLPIDEMGILPALRLSYKYLSSHLKHCFAYCSIFPKDYSFKKDQLILLWMAEGFLPQTKNRTMEEVGSEYFLTLESRSLFQKSSENKSCFVMHDLVSDLTKSISGQFISRLEDGCSHEITLTKFIVGKGSGTCIGELGNFTNLQGSLSILELQNIESPTDALNASLRDKKYLKELVLEWNVDTNFSESQRSVLDSLQPHTSLKSLTIRYYGGKSFSDWVGHPSFSNVASLELQNCTYCNNLPPLGQLQSLQNLYISGFHEVVTVGREFFGSGSSSSKPFGALKILKFENMWKWGEWNYFGDENEGVGFPQLEELSIRNCSKLTGGLPVHLPSLAILKIANCQQLVAPLPRTPAIRNLRLDDCNGVLLNEWPPGMQKLEIQRFDALEFLPKGMIESNGGLQELSIHWCSSLVSLPKDGLPSTLKTLKINSCKKLELSTNLDYSSLGKLSLVNCHSVKSFPLDLFPNLYHIEITLCGNLESLTVPENYEHDLVALEINITHCHNFVSFPKGGLRAPNLTRFMVGNCGSLRSLPDKMHILLPSLEDLHIWNCPKVESFPEGGLPSNLKSIWIDSCEKLIASRMGWDLQNLPFLKNFIIDGKPEVVESFPEEQLLPTSLTSLDISDFPNLKSLDKKGLQHLNALEELSISNCPKLNCMPEQGLPPSLSILEISRCPSLKKKLRSKEGKEWRKIAHLEHIRIDDEWIE